MSVYDEILDLLGHGDPTLEVAAHTPAWTRVILGEAMAEAGSRTRHGTTQTHRIRHMFDLPPDLERLHTLRTWHTLCLEAIDRKISDLQRQAEAEQGRRRRPVPPEWIVQLTPQNGRPMQVHRGDCAATGRRHRPATRDQALHLLTVDSVPGCAFCDPATRLGLLD